MDKSQAAKLLAILGLVVGSVYVLTPSVVEYIEGPEVSAAPVQQKARKKGPEMDVVFDAADPNAASGAAAALEQRLRAGGVAFDRAFVNAEGRVVTVLAPGGSRDGVLSMSAAGAVEEYAFSAVFPAVDGAPPPATDAERLALASPLFGKPVPPNTAPAADLSVRVDATDALTWTGTPPADGVVLTVDGLVRAVALPNVPVEPTAPATYTLASLVDASSPLASAEWDKARALLVAGALPTALTPYSAPEAAVADVGSASTAEHREVFPAWFKDLLLPYKIALGLDLQGGIDMTLAVELDEAVLGQVGRDASVAADLSKKDGLAVDTAYRDTVEPALHIEGAVPLEDLKTWMATKFPSYEYDSTQSSEGKTSHMFRMKEKDQKAVQDSATEQVLETLRKRIDATGVKEPTIVKKGTGRIGIQLPGKVDLQSAIDAIGTTAVLEFRLVDEEFDNAELERMLGAARESMPADQFEDDETLNRWLHSTGRLANDRLVLWEYADVGGEHQRSYPLPLKGDVILTGGDISNAGVNWDQNQQPYVSIEFKSRGASVFCTVTGENAGKRFAIVLDNEIRSAPNIRERICGGGARIEMGGSEDPLAEANTLSLVLRTGSLNAPVSIGQVTQVGASLGHDAIMMGTVGTLIGSLLVFLYMALWYRVSGLIANFTLIVNVLMVLALLALFGATLTLPGICGLALTIGMAVDANIIIYERIREELKLGVLPRKAVDLGFERAFAAIMDSNVTTAIAGIVLYSYGTGPIKGFAVSMNIGIITTLITALFVSRALMEYATRNSATRLSI